MLDSLKSVGAYLQSLLWSGGWSHSRQTFAASLFVLFVAMLVSALLADELHAVAAAAVGFGVAAALFVGVALIARRGGLSPVRLFAALAFTALVALLVLSAACSGAGDDRRASSPPSSGGAATEPEPRRTPPARPTPRPVPAEKPFTASEHRQPSFCLRVAVNDEGTGARLSMFVTSWRNVGSRPSPGQRRVDTSVIKSGSVTFDGVTRFIEYQRGVGRVAVQQLESGRVRVEWKYIPYYERGLLPADSAGLRFTKCADQPSAVAYQTFYSNTPAARDERARRQAANERSTERSRIATCNSLWRQMERATRASTERALYRQWRALDCTTNTLR